MVPVISFTVPSLLYPQCGVDTAECPEMVLGGDEE